MGTGIALVTSKDFWFSVWHCTRTRRRFCLLAASEAQSRTCSTTLAGSQCQVFVYLAASLGLLSPGNAVSRLMVVALCEDIQRTQTHSYNRGSLPRASRAAASANSGASCSCRSTQRFVYLHRGTSRAAHDPIECLRPEVAIRHQQSPKKQRRKPCPKSSLGADDSSLAYSIILQHQADRHPSLSRTCPAATMRCPDSAAGQAQCGKRPEVQ